MPHSVIPHWYLKSALFTQWKLANGIYKSGLELCYFSRLKVMEKNVNAVKLKRVMFVPLICFELTQKFEEILNYPVLQRSSSNHLTNQ